MTRETERRLAVVTGAAGGIGSATASKFAAEGWSLLLCDVQSESLEATADRLRSRGTPVETYCQDLADADYSRQLLLRLQGRPIDAVIHTAGLSPTMADATRILEVNYFATQRLVTAVRPRMAEGGCVVLIASMAAHMIASPEIDAALDRLSADDGPSALSGLAPTPEIAYPVSKRAVVKLVARQAAAFGEHKARILSISPGIIDTSMGRAERAASNHMDMLLLRTPAGRMGRADEIASVAAFLCSPGASYVSGCDIRVDGGVLAALEATD